MFKRDANLAYLLMLNLLYPAVLGSIFYSVLGNLYSYDLTKIGVPEFCCTAMMLSVVVFFSIDFVYTSLHEMYRIYEFIADCLILVVMQGAFDSINFLANHYRPQRFSGWMAVTFMIFAIWDYGKRKGMGQTFDRLWYTEAALAGGYLALALWNRGTTLPAVLSGFAAVAMGLLFRKFYSSHKKGISPAGISPAPISVVPALHQSKRGQGAPEDSRPPRSA